jgi:hypothetical protein
VKFCGIRRAASDWRRGDSVARMVFMAFVRKIDKLTGSPAPPPRDRRVVDNRVFLIALDELYRTFMKRHEAGELLACTRETAQVLGVAPAETPIEGYYSESEELTEYFRLMLALQREPRSREAELVGRPAFQRLRAVAESPLFGSPTGGSNLLNAGMDPLSIAMDRTFPQWTVASLTAAAYDVASASDDYSLVALAALAGDSVVLAALRETVVLYAIAMSGAIQDAKPEYVWQVDPEIQRRAEKFINAFTALFDDRFPRPAPDNAETYWKQCQLWKIEGRCVRIGYDDRTTPTRHYHWAIDSTTTGELAVREFWSNQIWTTQMYRDKQA